MKGIVTDCGKCYLSVRYVLQESCVNFLLANDLNDYSASLCWKGGMNYLIKSLKNELHVQQNSGKLGYEAPN